MLESFPDARFEFAGERLDNERNVTMVDSGTLRWFDAQRIIDRFPDNFHLHAIVTGEAKARFLRAADVFVQPSYAEAFPVAVLEAMQAGLPLIVTPVGALPEVLKDRVNCFFVNPGDSESIADRIADFIGSSALRAEMRRHNRSVSQSFSIAKMAEDVARVFDRGLNADFRC